MKVYKKINPNLKIGDYLEISGQKVKILSIEQKNENLWEFTTEDIPEELQQLKEGDEIDRMD